MVADPLAISSGAIGDQLAIGQRLVGDCILTVCLWLQKVCNFLGDWSATYQWLVGDQSATENCVKIVCNHCNWSAISRRPVGNLSATTKNLSTIDLVTERFHLQQPKPPCDQIVPATFCKRSVTSLRPPCNRPATTQNFARKEVADRLQAMCDWGFRAAKWSQLKNWPCHDAGFYTKGRPLVKSNPICPSDKLSWQPGCPVLNINIHVQGNFCISQGNGSSDNLPENLV